MGMFDKPKYLTGKEGFVEPGDTFWLHNARIEGKVQVNGQERDNAKLLVSREQDGDKVVVFTSGQGITGQVKRMDQTDRSAMPMHVRLDAIANTQAGRNATHVLAPADAPEPGDTQQMEAEF